MKTKQQTKMVQQTFWMDQIDHRKVCAMIKASAYKKVIVFSETIKGDDMSTNDSKAPQWFVNFADKQETFNSEVRQFMVKQEVFNQDIKQDVQHLKQDVQHLKQDVQLILSLPTVKQEINALNK